MTWWRHQMKTFSALLAICAGNSPAPGEFLIQRPVTRSFDVYFDLCPNKRLSKQLWGWWFETQSRPLWHHRNEIWVYVSHIEGLMQDYSNWIYCSRALSHRKLWFYPYLFIIIYYLLRYLETLWFLGGGDLYKLPLKELCGTKILFKVSFRIP